MPYTLQAFPITSPPPKRNNGQARLMGHSPNVRRTAAAVRTVRHEHLE